MEELKLTFFNVGYGEAMVLECPDSSCRGGVFTMVIDGGSAEAEEYADRSSGRVPLADALCRRVDHIDCMVNTHIHEDHTCGLAAAAELWPPRELWQTLPPNFYETAMYRLDTQQARTPSQGKFLRALNDYQLLCRKTREHGGVIRCLRAGAWTELCPGLRCQVLSPSAARADELESRCKDQFAERDPQAFLRKLDALDARMNNFSLMLLLEYRGVRILLPGDTNRSGYEGLPAQSLRADLFKVGHHGQRDGISLELLEQIRPAMVVCCASSDRRYESAHPETLSMVSAAGAALYFSDCPNTAGICGGPEPHQALEFTVDENGRLSARYLTAV